MNKGWLKNLLGIIEIVIIWIIGGILLNKPVLPMPRDTFIALALMVKEGDIFIHLISSLYRLLLGTFFGVVFSIPVGLLLGYSEKINTYFGRAFDFLYIIPKVVFLPVIIVLMGIGDLPKIFLIGIVLFFQQAVVIRDSARSIDKEILNSMYSLNPSFFQIVRHLLIPNCMPHIFTSLRSSLGTSFALLFITESFASTKGMGYFITKCMNQRNYNQMYASIIILALTGVIIYSIFGVVERVLCKWRYAK